MFLVHGRDDAARESLEALLRAFDLKVIPWRRAASAAGGGTPYTGDIVKAGMAMADAVVVLMTPDDIAHLRPDLLHDRDGADERTPTGQPRMNVVFEAGMAMAIDRDSVVIVEVGTVRAMSDIAGVNVIRLDDSVDRRRDLAERLRAAGLDVDLDDDTWRTAGTFAPAPPAKAAPAAAAPSTKAAPAASKWASYERFWQHFFDVASRDPHAAWVRARSRDGHSWVTLAQHPVGAWVVSFASGGRLRAEFYVDIRDGDRNVEILRALRAYRKTIEREFGAPLEWEELEGRRACRVAVYRAGSVENTHEHDEYARWFLETATRLRDVLGEWLPTQMS